MKASGEIAESTPSRASSKGRGPSFRQRVAAWPTGHWKITRWLVLVLVFLSGLTLLPGQQSYHRTTYRLGTVQSKAVIAEFDFPINKDPDVLESEQAAAVAAVPPVLAYSDSVQAAALEDLQALGRTILDVRRNRVPEAPAPQRDVALSQVVYLALLTLDSDAIFAQARERLVEYFERGILSEEAEEALIDNPRATLLRGGIEWVGPVDRFTSPSRLRHELQEESQRSPQGQAIVELVTQFARPNVTYEEPSTQQRRRRALEAVDPTVGRVLKGEKIIGAHERVTPEALRKLLSYEHWRERKAGHLLLQDRLLGYFGRALLLTLFLIGFVLYLLAYRQEIVTTPSEFFLLSITFAGFLLLGGLTLNVLRLSGYLIPVAGFAVLIALLYDEKLALIATGFLTAIVGLVSNQGTTFILVIGFGSVAAILSVHQLRDRRQLYRLLLHVPLVHLATLGAVGMMMSMAFEELVADALYLVANPFIASGFALFAVPLSETLSGKCTNLTLLELLDLNRPLLRRLMLETPGTYHHSLMVGTLAEAGAQAIGANPLMARVQGYYHDIGKIRKPEYFIENLMAGRKNPHDKLAPTMSRLILESHVRDGIALARENKLPRIVRDAIAQHHGTSLMTYFYHRAHKKDPQTADSDYRYPGPRPSSRELGIVMLADQIDAASRSLEEPTPSRLRGLIKQLVERRMLEGELDGSHLTLKDLADLREAFIPILTALFHGRIVYPKVEQKSAKATASATTEPAAKAEG